MKLARDFQIWGELACAGIPNNGIRLAMIPDVVSAQERRTLSGQDTLVVTIPRLSPAYAQLQERRVIRVTYDDTAFDEWRILEFVEKREADGQVTVVITCADPLVDLGERGMVRRVEATGAVFYDFQADSLTPTQHLDSFIVPALTAEGFTWYARGTVDPTTPVDEVYSMDTPAAALARLAADTNTELRLRRNGTTDYKIDLLNAIGAGGAALDLRFGKNLPWLRRNRMTADQMTRAYGRGAEVDTVHASIRRARWKITAIAGGGPYNVSLADPSGSEGPIAFDDQLNSRYLIRKDGTSIQISDSVASSQVVVLASNTGIAVNDLVGVADDTAGTESTFLEAPLAKATYGLKVGVVDRPDLPATVNLGGNPVMRDYAGSAEADGYLVVGTATATKTTTAARWRTAGASMRVQASADGNGYDTPYNTIRPTAAEPWISAFVSSWLEAGQVRFELILAKDAANLAAAITRVGTTCTATTSVAHGLQVGQLVEHVNAGQAEYNGLKVVTSVPTSTTYTFEVTGTPTTPSTGTITWARAWRLPDGESRATNTARSQWVNLGVAGIDAYTLGATRAKVRMLQDGGTALDLYWDAYQITATAAHDPFCEGSGGTRLWQAMNRVLLEQSQPGVRYECSWIDLKQLNPAVWAYEDLTLGALANIRDDVLNITASTRILEYSRELTQGEQVDLVLSNRPDDVLDLLVRPRRPPRVLPQATSDSSLEASAYFTPVPGVPGNVAVRLAPNIAGGTIYYWLGNVGDLPPQRSLVQAGSPTDTLWGTYAAPFTVNRAQSADLQLHIFLQRGSQRSPTRSFVIDHNTAPSATLVLSEPVGGTLHIGFDYDDDTVAVDVYRKKNGAGNGWPTTDNNVTGPLDPAQKVAGNLSVAFDGGGFDKNGTAIAGGAVPDESGYANTDVAKVILVPKDRAGNIGARVTATRTMTGAMAAALTSWSVNRTANGILCDDPSHGARYTFSWTVNAGVSDGSHDVQVEAVAFGASYTALQSAPASTLTQVVGVPYRVSGNKFDPVVSVTLRIYLLDAVGTVLQTELVSVDGFTSDCAL